MTSSGVIGVPSWNRALGFIPNVTDEKSSGYETHSQMRQYSAEGSSRLPTISASYMRPRPPAGSPFTENALRLSNEPSANARSVPPFGASGFTQSKFAKPGLNFGSPTSDSAWWRVPAAAAL